jgi:phospholipase/carboxylesterase
VGGIFALSSFLNNGSSVYRRLRLLAEADTGADTGAGAAASNAAALARRIPLFQCHGTADPVVRFEAGQETCRQLRALGVRCQWAEFDGLDHQLDPSEIEQLTAWILETAAAAAAAAAVPAAAPAAAAAAASAASAAAAPGEEVEA